MERTGSAIRTWQTEQAAATTQLQLLQGEFHALIDWCGAGVLVLNADRIVQRANALACRFFALPHALLVGRSLREIARTEDLLSMIETAEGDSCTQYREIRLPLPSGLSLLVTMTPILSEGFVTAFLMVARDVTELRRLETIRRDFVANVSHELRTPLASIRAMAETLQDGALLDPSVADRFLGTIVTEAQRLTRIAEDLLVLSNAESGSPQKKPINLSALIDEVVSRFRPQAEKTGITLATAASSEQTVNADRDQIEQVLINLIDNAIKYTPAGGHIQVRLDGEGDFVTLLVQDTGIGIMPEDLPRIFERFYRVDKARSRQSGGTGLGLAIVKHIVEAHGGKVMVESQFNHGSTFSFTLPARQDSPV